MRNCLDCDEAKFYWCKLSGASQKTKYRAGCVMHDKLRVGEFEFITHTEEI